MTLGDFVGQQHVQRHGASRGLFATAELLVYFMNDDLSTPSHSCTLLLPVSPAVMFKIDELLKSQDWAKKIQRCTKTFIHQKILLNMLLNPNCSITENGRATWYDVYLLSWFHYFLTSEYPVYKMHGMSYQYTVCLKKRTATSNIT